jgi:hypothetical protein
MMESSEHTQKERESEQLERQSADQDISTNPLLFPGPIVGARDSGPVALHAERNNVADDKYQCEAATRDTEDSMPGFGKDADDESRDEHVVCGSDENGGEDCRGQCDDKRCLAM